MGISENYPNGGLQAGKCGFNFEVHSTLNIMKKSFHTITFLFLSIAAWSQFNELASANPSFTDSSLSNTEEGVKSREASFPGGLEALKAYLADHFQYPQSAVENGLEGTVIVKFLIGKDGKTQNPEIIQSLHPILDAEALRVINSMPEWQPRLKNGQAVTARIEIPFEVSIR